MDNYDPTLLIAILYDHHPQHGWNNIQEGFYVGEHSQVTGIFPICSFTLS